MRMGVLMDDDDWLHCLRCGARIARLAMREGRTILAVDFLGVVLWIERGDVPCVRCGNYRQFESLKNDVKKQGRGLTVLSGD